MTRHTTKKGDRAYPFESSLAGVANRREEIRLGRYPKLAPWLFSCLVAGHATASPTEVIDTHLHGDRDPVAQLEALRASGITTIAVSTSWEDQQRYVEGKPMSVLHGLMFPCPQGKVPYSLQDCHADGREWPGVEWTEVQIKSGRIDFLGEILTQYYGISPSDARMDPYYSLAVRHDLPVGIHTGSAGPDHGSPNFREDLGNPALLRDMLVRHPGIRLWIMHAGAPFFDETVALMREYPNVHADISVINNPRIVPPEAFAAMMRTLMDAGLGDRIMFGSDNADIATVRASLDALTFLDAAQKQAILHDNAERFFRIERNAGAVAPGNTRKVQDVD
ncbi:amidohydrolase family protein [Pseudoxanthomonas beigongshangi]